MQLSPVEQRFVDGDSSDEDDALIFQQASGGRYADLCKLRAVRMRYKNLERMGDEVARLVPALRSFTVGEPHILIMAAGLALLIEEIHHLNGGTPQK